MRKSASRRADSTFERMFTRPGENALETVTYELRNSIITEPGRLDRLRAEGRRDPRGLVAARDRHRGLQVLPQGRHPRRREAGRALGAASSSTASPTRSARPARSSAATSPTPRTPRPSRPSSPTSSSTRRPPSTRPSGSTAASTTSTASRARAATAPGTRRRDAIVETAQRLRAPAVLGLLHPERRRRPDGDLRARQERGAPLQVRLGHGHELLEDPRPPGEALGRRHLVAA